MPKLTETNLKRLFLHLKRVINSTENILKKNKEFNYLKFKPKNQSTSEENKEIIHTHKKSKP